MGLYVIRLAHCLKSQGTLVYLTALFLVLSCFNGLFVETVTYVVTVVITNFTLKIEHLFTIALTMIRSEL